MSESKSESKSGKRGSKSREPDAWETTKVWLSRIGILSGILLAGMEAYEELSKTSLKRQEKDTE